MLARPLSRVLIAGLVLFATACDDGPVTPEDVAGTYVATTLLVTEGGVTFNALDLGAELEMTLNENGTTVGALFVPGGDEDGTDLVEDLAGTWTLSEDGERVTFSQTGDTFIRDVEFLVEGNQLLANELGIEVVLTKR